MTEKSSATVIEHSISPLATVQDIQRRLLRPSSLRIRDHAPIFLSTFDIQSGGHSQIKANSQNQQKIAGRGRDTEIADKEKKLEDYLDPYLLYITSSKISPRRNVARTNLKRESVIDSEFPANGFELSLFGGESSSSKRKRIQGNDKAVDLRHDSDHKIKDDEEEHAVPTFWWFN